MAINQKHVKSMYRLANFYQERISYINAKRYYLMAVNHKHVKSMHMLAKLYEKDKVNKNKP